MQVETLGIVISNAILVVGAVWRVSASLTKIEAQLLHVNEKLNIQNEAAQGRFSTLESRLLNLESFSRSKPQGR